MMFEDSYHQFVWKVVVGWVLCKPSGCVDLSLAINGDVAAAARLSAVRPALGCCRALEHELGTAKTLVEASVRRTVSQLTGTSQQQSSDSRSGQHLKDGPVGASASLQQRLAALATSALVICNALAGFALPDELMPAALAKPKLTPDEQLTIEIFKRNTPSVVNVTNLAAK